MMSVTSLKPFILLLGILATTISFSQSNQAQELLDRSIAYHDPEGKWGNEAIRFGVMTQQPGKEDRTTQISFDPSKGYFSLTEERGSIKKTYVLDGKNCLLSLNGSSEFTTEEGEKHGVTCERAGLLKNYYTFLYGLPMKLKDQGTIIHPEVKTESFKGRIYNVIKVTYSPEVGKDTWYFYFDPETSALRAYQFYHNQSENDGEYILLEEEEVLNGMQIPKIRKWFVNKTAQTLGTDILSVK